MPADRPEGAKEMKVSWATKSIFIFLAVATMIGLGTGAAWAQTTITYVSSAGDDTKDCATPGTACRTFAGAQVKVFEGGMIACIDAGFFGSATITKSVTIDCQAGGGAANNEMISINAPGKNVRLRNLAINGL